MSERYNPSVHDLRRLMEDDALLAFVEQHGGTRYFVPKIRSVSLIEKIGIGPASMLVSYHGGNYIKVPLARSWRAAIYRARGMSYAQIAVRLGITERGVWSLLKKQGLTGADVPNRVVG